MPDLWAVVGVAAVTVVALAVWRWRHPVSFWRWVGFPVRVTWVRWTWGSVAEACGLSRTRSRWTRHGREPRWVAPSMGVPRRSSFGWWVRVGLHPGQTPEQYAAEAVALAHAWACHSVRVAVNSPGRVRLVVTVRDPLTRALPASVVAAEGLAVTVGVTESGEPWALDLAAQPHWLNAGATQSGKSTLLNALVSGLASQPVVLVGFDLKGGMELAPYAPRLSRLATSRGECLDVLTDLGGLLSDRMGLCRARGVRHVGDLEGDKRPLPVVVLVDEVAELYLAADKVEKEQAARTSTGLLRVAQLGRALGVHLVVSGQRVGSDLGQGVTALRAQLSGRVCHRVNDPETATMTLGDLHPDALHAARAIPARLPGVAVVATADGTWTRARAAYVSPEQAAEAAARHAHLAPVWGDVLAMSSPPLVLAPV